MNVIQSGDHVVIVVPATFTSAEARKHSNDRIKEMPDSLSAAPAKFNMTWSPIGPTDSDPYVLFVVRGSSPENCKITDV